MEASIRTNAHAQLESELGRRERKKLEVERRIRRAAAELFHEKGYEATTVDEIAARADVAKGTFFNYFPRKDALLGALAADMFEQLTSQLGPVDEWEGTARQQLIRYFAAVWEFVVRDPELFKVVLIENMRNFWLRTEEEPVEKEFRALTRRALARGQARGEFAGRVDIELAARLVEAAYITTTVDCLKEGASDEAFRQEMTAKIDIIFRGLGATEPAGEGEEK